jgi:short-subunit dehydrogenase
MQTLKDKNILIIGTIGGIGSRTAKLLAGSGTKLFLTGRNSEKPHTVAALLSPRCCPNTAYLLVGTNTDNRGKKFSRIQRCLMSVCYYV